ncbi:MAG TPA: toluene monooxygenase [Polyangia bacterium]
MRDVALARTPDFSPSLVTPPPQQRTPPPLPAPRVRPLPTWSHLPAANSAPSEYDLAMDEPTDHGGAPFELDPELFLNRWHRRYREGSALVLPERFRDPDALTFTTYATIQAEQEIHVSRLLDHHHEIDHDAALAPLWRSALARWYTPARYARHALSMGAAYAGQMAPSVAIANCLFFQAADESRIVDTIAYRTAELAHRWPGYGFARDERAAFESDPIWQGFRALLEPALCAWDWAESFVAFTLVAKPALDEVMLAQLACAGAAHGDALLLQLSGSHLRDVERSRRWSAALVRAVRPLANNRRVVQGWLDRWVPLGDRAMAVYLEGLPGLDHATAARRAQADCAAFRNALGFR